MKKQIIVLDNWVREPEQVYGEIIGTLRTRGYPTGLVKEPTDLDDDRIKWLYNKKTLDSETIEALQQISGVHVKIK